MSDQAQATTEQMRTHCITHAIPTGAVMSFYHGDGKPWLHSRFFPLCELDLCVGQMRPSPCTDIPFPTRSLGSINLPALRKLMPQEGPLVKPGSRQGRSKRDLDLFPYSPFPFLGCHWLVPHAPSRAGAALAAGVTRAFRSSRRVTPAGDRRRRQPGVHAFRRIRCAIW